MELLIVTGLSGAGKTRVINALEDIGFYCVDNIPPALLGGFADLCYAPAAAHRGRTAIVMDSRSGKMFRELPSALEELRRTFRPEFLNRIDETIVFRALTETDIAEIARRMLRSTAQRMEELGIHLEVSDEAAAELARVGFDPLYGARPLRRAIQTQVEDAAAEQLLEGKIGPGDRVAAAVCGNRVSLYRI